MNFDALDKLVAEATGVEFCPICGTPYMRKHAQQKTCATKECRRIWHNRWLREYRKQQREADPDAYRAYRAEAQRKYRHKKRDAELVDRNLQKLQDHWTHVANFEKEVAKDGYNYGERQKEKTLAMIPKIDLGGLGYDNVHSKDNEE